MGVAWALDWAVVGQVLAAILPVWLLGALTGYLIPRPAPGKTPSATSWAFFLSGAGFRRWAILYHLAIIVRDFWRTYCAPGTFRAFCKAVVSWASGRGFNFEFPAAAADGSSVAEVGTKSSRDADNWYVTQKDLAFFQYHMEQGGISEGASAWEVLMEKEVPNLIRYVAYRRTLKNGKTEYKSVTYSPDATAQEFMDLYFDDDFRPKWDTMIIHHEVLEHGDFAQRQQVVRWTRRFPFKFLSDREYTIARRLFKTDDAMYGLTKVIDHPSSRRDTQVVKMDVFYSMWRSRTVECPWGSGKAACETVLLHHEQFKILENLSRFAVRHGMWGFVRNLAERTPEFTAARRARGVGPNEADPMAYGHNGAPNPPSSSTGYSTGSNGGANGGIQMSQSSLSLCSMDSSSVGGSGGYGMGAGAGHGGAMSLSRAASEGLPGRPKQVPGRVKGFLAMAVAGVVAVAVKRSTSVPSGLENVKALKSKRRNLRQSNSMLF